MKKEYPLPEPRNNGVIQQIIGPGGENLRKMEKEAGIKPYDIKMKPKKNQVHIVGTKKQVEIIIKSLKEIIEKEMKRQKDAKDDMVVPVPAEKTGLLMGNNGSTIKLIEKETNTTIDVRGKAAHIKGSLVDKEQAAIKINEILKKSTPSTEGKIKVNLPPNCGLGPILGHRYSNVNKIKSDTGAHIEVIEDAIYVSGEDINCKKAIIKIKMKIAERSHKKPIPDQFNFIHTTHSGQTDYKLEPFECPNPLWNGEKHFKVYRIEDPEVCSPEELNTQELQGIDSEELNIQELQGFILKVLEEIKQENEGHEIKADLWCHFGQLYIGNIDEDDQNKTYNLKEIREELRKKERDSWRLRFNPAMEELKFREMEKTLQNVNNGVYVIEPHIRHDFQFFTPNYTSVRAKVFMDMDGNLDPKFSKCDIDIRKDQLTDSASKVPKYLLCDQFQTKARVNIMILSEGLDCRLAIRTVLSNDDHDGKAKEFEENVTKYLDKMSIDKEVHMPEDSEMPQDYTMYYWRKCSRRSFPYEGGFSITISEEEVMDVVESGKKKTDIHLHYDEWDRLLTSGQWEPKTIVEKLPQFLKFVSDVQSNISDPQEEKDM